MFQRDNLWSSLMYPKGKKEVRKWKQRLEKDAKMFTVYCLWWDELESWKTMCLTKQSSKSGKPIRYNMKDVVEFIFLLHLMDNVLALKTSLCSHGKQWFFHKCILLLPKMNHDSASQTIIQTLFLLCRALLHQKNGHWNLCFIYLVFFLWTTKGYIKKHRKEELHPVYTGSMHKTCQNKHQTYIRLACKNKAS